MNEQVFNGFIKEASIFFEKDAGAIRNFLLKPVYLHTRRAPGIKQLRKFFARKLRGWRSEAPRDVPIMFHDPAGGTVITKYRNRPRFKAETHQVIIILKALPE